MATLNPRESTTSTPNDLSPEQDLTSQTAWRNGWLEQLNLADATPSVQAKISDSLLRTLEQQPASLHTSTFDPEISTAIDDACRALLLDSHSVTVSVAPAPDSLDLLSLSFYPERTDERAGHFQKMHTAIEKALEPFDRSRVVASESSFGTAVVKIAPDETDAIKTLALLEEVKRMS